MSIYHLSTKPISRSSGRSATAAAAYRSGTKIVDSRTGEIHDYSKKSGVLYSKIITPDDSIKIKDRGQLWNLAELSEKRKDARVAREIVVALPAESGDEVRFKLVEIFAKELSKKYGCAVDVCVHAPSKEGDDRNHHAHLLLTTRQVAVNDKNEVIFGDKTDLELSDTKLSKLNKLSGAEQIKDIREMWEHWLNLVLKAQNLTTVSAKSHKDRGLTIEPTIKMGVVATSMERRGVKTDRGDINRSIKELNNTVPAPDIKDGLSADEAVIINDFWEQCTKNISTFKHLPFAEQAKHLGLKESTLLKARQMVWELEEKQQIRDLTM